VVDPICGMTVAALPSTPHVEHDGQTVYFCCVGCQGQYEAERMGAAADAASPKQAEGRAKVATAVDPICGMTVLAVPDTPHLEHDGETVYFCCDGCKAKFEKEEHAVAAT
jgi:YHS domain-containing protein